MNEFVQNSTPMPPFVKRVKPLLDIELAKRLKEYNTENLFYCYTERTDMAWCGYRSILHFVYYPDMANKTDWMDFSVGCMGRQSELTGKLELDRLNNTAASYCVTKVETT